MKITFISSEVFPFSKTGGLADVSGSLPKELEKLGFDIKVFTPYYKSLISGKHKLKPTQENFSVEIKINFLSRHATFLKSFLPGSNIEVIFVDNPHYFDRESIYTEDEDEGERFVFFQKAVIEFLKGTDWIPDLIHVNDWQSALVPYYAKSKYGFLNRTATLLTLHNVGYQGIFPKEILKVADVEGKMFFPMGPAEFFGKFNFLKMGIFFADKINTVSPTYAKEILTAEHGAGLEGVLTERKGDVTGILNGVDYKDWNPETDPLIFRNYNAGNLHLKVENKKMLCKSVGLKFKKEIPLVGMVSRLVEQKGLPLLLEALPTLLKLNIQWVILGSGKKEFEEELKKFALKYPHKIQVRIGYDNEFAHRIEAGADLFLMPSQYEPCGLNQIYSLKYGTLPVVHLTGGLADTVVPYRTEPQYSLLNADGFGFNEYKTKNLIEEVEFAIGVFEEKETWKQLQINAMSRDYSWSKSAKEYAELYANTVKKRLTELPAF